MIPISFSDFHEKKEALDNFVHFFESIFQVTFKATITVVYSISGKE